MRYARNCAEIMVNSFYAILETKDYMNVVIGWDGYEAIPDFNEEQAREWWRKIYNEYCLLSKNSKTIMFFDIKCQLIYLENRLFVATSLLDRLEFRKTIPEVIIQYSEALAKWKIRINPENDIDIEIAKARKALKGSQTKISIKESELENLVKDDEDGEPLTLTRQLLKMSLALNKDKIDPKTTSMLEYIEMLNEIEEISKIREQHGSKLSAVD